MKGLVVELYRRQAIILTDDGLFTKVKNNSYEIGQSIQIIESSKKRSKFITGMASLAAALAVTTIGSAAYFTPTDYVSLDVNPSVEYTLNMFDRILDVNAVNEDGESILSGLDMNNMSIEDAVKTTLNELIAEGYLTDDPDSGVIITTSNKKIVKAEELAKELDREVKDYFKDIKNVAAEVKVEAVGSERVQEVRELGVTPGKLNLVEKLQLSTSGSINRDEWLNMPVKDINKAIKENQKLNNKGKNKGKDKAEENDDNNNNKDKGRDRDNNKNKDKYRDRDNNKNINSNRDQDDNEDRNKNKERYNKNNESKNNNDSNMWKNRSNGKSIDKDRDKDGNNNKNNNNKDIDKYKDRDKDKARYIYKDKAKSTGGKTGNTNY